MALRRPFGRGKGGADDESAGGAIDWLIVGLGNPGREYDGTRHNVGFAVAEELVRRWGLRRGKDRFRARLAEGRVGGAAAIGELGRAPVRVAVLEPQTYMNDAGRSVGPARGSYKLAPERVLVVHDEIDLPFGDVRARVGGGLAGHNGLKSLARELGTSEFARVRVGVGRPESSDPEIVSAYVLGRFREERASVQELIERAADEVERVVLGGGSPG
ncbi:MAG TPA: aminoacyl-tRNA hydrolase [Solirubrobacteraceae bacterium]|nr:aminoacyl-tRNA hydrolase [Solirubrobacteraceae bacterium]